MDRARTLPVTALPFLAGAGVLPKKWGEPESKAYVRDVATNAHPFRFVSPKNFGDEALANAAHTCLKKSEGGPAAGYGATLFFVHTLALVSAAPCTPE